MARYQIVRLVLILGLVALLIPVALAQAQGGSGEVVIRDGGALSDVSTITMTNVPAPDDGTVYEGWFVSDSGDRKMSTGILDVSSGEINQPLTAANFSSVRFTLAEQNNSGQSGWALLTQVGSSLQVELILSDGDLQTELVHIHSGQCGQDTLGGVVHGLTSFVGGSGDSSTTVAGVDLVSLRNGDFAVNSHQVGNPAVYTACGNIPTLDAGENLFGDFDRFVVTVEPVPDPDPAPSGTVIFVHKIPNGGILHIRHLVYSWRGNPEYGSGAANGLPKGIVVGLRDQTQVAWDHAALAQESARAGDLLGVQNHACHVVNIIGGTAGSEFKASCGNPGDGFGVLAYASDAATHAALARTAAPDDSTIGDNAAEVVDASDAAADWAGRAWAQALLARDTNDLLTARLYINNVESLLSNNTVRQEGALHSANRAYVAAQDMGTYTITDLPSVGEPLIPQMAKGAIIGGIVVLVLGMALFLRPRTRLGSI